MYNIYTDGSTRRNGKDGNIGGYAFVVYDTWQERVVDAYAKINIENTTNNKMELTAILSALFMWEKRMRNKDQKREIYLYSDSQYALNSLFVWSKGWANNGWKTATGTKVKNLDLIKPFYDKQWGPFLKNVNEGKRNSWSKFYYQWVQGHSESTLNIIADKLATGELTPEKVIGKAIWELTDVK